MSELSPGAVFAGHRIEGVAGRGGMGIVYRATHLALDHVVALKVIAPQLAGDERFRRRFADESRLAVSIRHPNVVAIHHAGEERGLLFVTMDLIEGVDLRGLLAADGRLEPRRAANLVAGVGAALDAAHARGLVHRDIKPGNVLVERRAGGEHVYLTDFGLARQIDASTGVTASGAFVGTLDYVAPEQIRGERVDARTDVYALGCLVFELLAGAAPFAAREDEVAKLYAHLEEEPPRLRALRPELPGELGAVIERALAKQPRDRFPSAGDLARALGAAAMGEPTVEAEHSVATGAAAPLTPPETASPGSTPLETAPSATAKPDVSAPTEPLRERIEAAEPPVVDAPPPRAPRARRPPRARRRSMRIVALAAAGTAIAAAAAAALLFVLNDGGAGEDGAEAAGGDAERAEEVAPRVAGAPIEVGGMPIGIAAGAGAVWVSNRRADLVQGIDPRRGRVVAELPLPGPEGMAYGEGRFWAVSGAGTVLRIDPERPAAADSFEVGGTPRGIAVGPDAVWVAGGRSNAVARIDLANGEVDLIEDVGAFPRSIAAGAGAVWVSVRDEDVVARIDPVSPRAGVEERIDVGSEPKGLAVAPDNSAVWVANEDDNTVSVINPRTGAVAEVRTCFGPRDVAFAARHAWVSCAEGTVRVYDLRRRPVARVQLGEDGAEDLAAGLGGIWVANGLSGSVSRIEPGTRR